VAFTEAASAAAATLDSASAAAAAAAAASSPSAPASSAAAAAAAAAAADAEPGVDERDDTTAGLQLWTQAFLAANPDAFAQSVQLEKEVRACGRGMWACEWA
jgi:hypothetical protein